MRILLAEDDRFLADGLAIELRDSGYAVDVASSGTEADEAVGTHLYDLLILDLGLPKLDGLEVLKRLRRRGQTLPVLILTARDGLEDRVAGLDLGANDYITKPFDLPELKARIRALLRKDHWNNRTAVQYGALEFDTTARTARVSSKPLTLSARELAVLEILLQRLDSPVSKERLTDLLSSWDSEVTHNAVGITVHRLRKKLEPFGLSIKALRGLGYQLSEEMN